MREEKGIHFFPTFSLPEAPWFGGWLCPDNMVVMILGPLSLGSTCQWTLAEESEKAGLKLSIQKTKIMASGPITSWQIEGGKVEAVMNFLFLGSKITADGDCSHEINRSLLLGRKAMTNLDSILKSTDIILPTKVCLVKAMVFPVVMYGCESWPIRKADH